MIGRYFHRILIRVLIGKDLDAVELDWRRVCVVEYGEEPWW